MFLTNALTGWEPRVQKPLPFPELEEERDRAERVKQDTPVLVILGNPPYNGFAGMAVDEERELSAAYRTTGGSEGPARRPRIERPVRPVLPHGRAAHRGEDWAGRGLLHLQLLVAGRDCPSLECGSATWKLSTLFASTVSTAIADTKRERRRRMGTPDPSVFSTAGKADKHPGGHRNCTTLGPQGRPYSCRDRRLSPSVGGQTKP